MDIIVKRLQLGLLYTNAYVVISKNDSLCVVIDPACDNGEMANFITSNNLAVSAVLLTHGHFDHCGGVSALIKGKNIPVYCSREDAQMAANVSKNPWGVPCKDCIVTDFVSDGQKIAVGGFEFSVLSTPGHTKGSVCYIIGDYLFSGDTLFAGGIGRTDLEGGDMADMRRSLQKLKKLDKNYFICPGHQETSRLLHEMEYNPYLK